MTWFLLAAVTLTFAVRLLRHRQRRFAITRSDPVSTLIGEMSRKQSTGTRAALDAASSRLTPRRR